MRRALAAITVFVCLGLVLPLAASAAPPLVTTKAATGVEHEAATLHGLVNPTGLPTTYWFEYGTSEKYGSKTSELSAGAGFANVEVSALASGLSPTTTYHFRLVAKNFSGTTKGLDETFTTLSTRAMTEAATGIYAKEATLNGSVNPKGTVGTYYFEYGTSEKYGSKTSEESAGEGSELVKKSTVVKSLSPSTTYHFRIVLVSGKETFFGADKAFTTPERSWSLQTTPSQAESLNSHLEGVSCLSGTECVAVGEANGLIAELWNGSEWSLQSMAAGGAEIESVSCTSFSACTAVGRTATATHVQRWNGSEWKVQESPNPGGMKSSQLNGVSCTSSSFCAAIGFSTAGESSYPPLAEAWNGSEWKLQEMPSPAGKAINYVHDVSCTSSSACTAVGYSSGTGLVERWNGTEWKVETTLGAAGDLESVSCTSSSFCVAVGNTPPSGERAYAASWNGSEWKTMETPNPAGVKRVFLNGVSCASSSVCHAVGTYELETGTALPLTEKWNGSKWELLPTPLPGEADGGGLRDVSCPSTSICEAVGSWSDGGIGYTLGERYE